MIGGVALVIKNNPDRYCEVVMQRRYQSRDFYCHLYVYTR